MKKNSPALMLCCTLVSGPVLAGGSPLDLSVPDADLSRSEADMAKTEQGEPALAFTADNEQYEESWLTGSEAHKYMGLGALALVALAAISPKEEGGPHEYFATGATVLAAGAATSGFIYHWEDFHFRDGFTDPDNLHMMLGFLGTLAMVAAVSEAPEAGHSGPGIIGGVAMATAVKITW